MFAMNANVEMAIRRLTSTDAEILLAFYHSLAKPVTDFYQPFGPVVQAETITTHLAETDAGRHISLGLVEPGGAIAGHAFILSIETEKPVFGIGLCDRVHGRGWGRALMQYVLEEGDRKKLPLVTLTVVKHNTKARAMYEKIGFALKGEETFRQPNDSFYMERTLPMDELSKAIDIGVKGALRDRALAECEKQLKAWGVVWPPFERLVFDFGLGDFYKTGEIECWIANEVGEGYCGKFLFVFDGQTCPLHHHRTKHETFYIVKGKVRMTFDGSVRAMVAGDVLPVPPGKVHSFTGHGPALLLEVSKPCIVGDNYFADMKIPIGGNYRP